MSSQATYPHTLWSRAFPLAYSDIVSGPRSRTRAELTNAAEPIRSPIAIVADKLWRARRSGIGRVTEGLSAGLAEQGVSALVVGFRDRTSTSDSRYRLPVYEIPIPRQVAAAMSAVGLKFNLESLVKPAISVVHNSNIATPVRTRLPAVVTVHDLSPIDLPPEYSAHVRKTFHESVKTSEASGHIALCVSQATATRLIEAFPGFEQRVVVGHLGPSLPSNARIVSPDAPTRILFVGEITRRKRPDLVVQAFERSGLPSHWRLTIAGNAGNAYKALMALIDESSVANRIDVVLSASDEQLAGHYSTSAFLVLPSDLEGFGVPVLDAISIGLPVVVTEGSSLPEVAGPGGIVISRGSADELAAAMQTLALDTDIYRRLSLAATEHAKRFSWRSHAEAAMDAYGRAISGGG